MIGRVGSNPTASAKGKASQLAVAAGSKPVRGSKSRVGSTPILSAKETL